MRGFGSYEETAFLAGVMGILASFALVTLMNNLGSPIYGAVAGAFGVICVIAARWPTDKHADPIAVMWFLGICAYTAWMGLIYGGHAVKFSRLAEQIMVFAAIAIATLYSLAFGIRM